VFAAQIVARAMLFEEVWKMRTAQLPSCEPSFVVRLPDVHTSHKADITRLGSDVRFWG
jgi:hypothetical protein